MDVSKSIGDQETGHEEWAGRSQYWQIKSDKRPEKRKRREREARGLVLAGHGISITVHRGTLLIQDGNTHYPAEKRQYRFFKGDLSLPPRIVLVDGSGNITLDALDWLAAQKVDLIRLDWRGHVLSVATASSYAAEHRKVAWQIATRANETKRVAFAIPLIQAKVKATLFNLRELLPPSSYRDNAIENAKAALVTLKSKPPKNVPKLLAIEGTVAQGYFYAWRALQIKWRAQTRYPIPDEWKRYFSRTSLKLDKRLSNQDATHPVNAMLNYVYATLEAETRINVIAEGYEPSVGIMHDRVEAEKHSFVYDRMEPMRPVTDRAILKLIKEEAFSGADFIMQLDGVCRVNANLARLLAREGMALGME